MNASDLRLFDLEIAKLKGEIMSELSDKLAEIDASLDAALARVREDVDALNAEIADLKQKVSDGTATAADMEMLASLKARIDALDPTTTATLPTEPTPAEPTVEEVPPTP